MLHAFSIWLSIPNYVEVERGNRALGNLKCSSFHISQSEEPIKQENIL